jgi:hypothetical protein
MNGSSRRVILVCEECGERMVLGGPRSVWYSESTRFGCECGRELTDRPDVTRKGHITSAARPTSPLHS